MAVQGAYPPMLGLVGRFRVSVDGTDREVPSGSQRLLAFVGLRRIPLDRGYVAGMLWPGNDDVRAIGNLRSALWRLRGAGIQLIAADKRSLALEPATEVDVHRLAEWAGRLIGGRPESADLDLCTGDAATLAAAGCELLADWHDEWILLERERLRQRILHALELAAGMLNEQGRHEESATVAARAVAADPLRESAQRTLIAAQVAAGDAAAATRTYERFAGAVRRELGVEPSRRMVALLPRSPTTQTPTVTSLANEAEGAKPTSALSWAR